MAIALSRNGFISILMDNARLNVNIKDKNGRTPLHVAIKDSRQTAFKLLL